MIHIDDESIVPQIDSNECDTNMSVLKSEIQLFSKLDGVQNSEIPLTP